MFLSPHALNLPAAFFGAYAYHHVFCNTDGLILVSEWNSLQHPVASAFLAALYSDYMLTSRTAHFSCGSNSFSPADLRKFAQSQVCCAFYMRIKGHLEKIPIHNLVINDNDTSGGAYTLVCCPFFIRLIMSWVAILWKWVSLWGMVINTHNMCTIGELQSRLMQRLAALMASSGLIRLIPIQM